MRGTDASTCEHFITMSPSPLGWKRKGNITPAGEPITLHLQAPPGDSFLKAWILSGQLQSPTHKDSDQREQSPV